MNYCIEVLMEEHKNINRMLTILRRICIGILDGNEVDTDEFKQIIDFMKTYSDKLHLEKEEKFLFSEMTKNLGKLADNLINHGMLAEHTVERDYALALSLAVGRYSNNPGTEYKLDILASAMGYARLMKNHTDKEDRTVYTFAEEKLEKETFDAINTRCKLFEGKHSELKAKYIELLDKLEEKYIKE